MSPLSDDWTEDCLYWRGEVLTGKCSHWCPEWDDLPVDESTHEWPCGCGIKEHVDDRDVGTQDV